MLGLIAHNRCMRILPAIEFLPAKIRRLVDKARAAEQGALAAVQEAQQTAQRARDVSQAALRGEVGLRVSPYGDGYLYSGQWGRNTPHGIGQLDAASKGGVYLGQFHHGYFQGCGIFEFDPDKPGGSLRYTGTFWRDLRHGHGLYEWRSGARWLGQMKMEDHAGHGIYFFPDGRVFEGHFGGKPAHRHDTSQRNDRIGVQWQLDGAPPKIGAWVGGVFTAFN
jgi:hypothetical protein